MSYPLHTKAIVCYIEAHIKEPKINYKDLENRIGFSLAHIRDFFQQNTSYSLAKYIRMRKIKSSALDLINTSHTILEISYQYGFSNPETYTRAFQNIMGMPPSVFRSEHHLVGKEELISGVYGIGLLPSKEQEAAQYCEKHINKDNESTFLYGVPKIIDPSYGGNTAYPTCLMACSEYLGESLSYPYVMVASGAAFRFVWNHSMWDLSNIDIFHTLTESNDIYSVGPAALGRTFAFLERTKSTTKEMFIDFIKEHLDKGYPCIALGIIGPPEPCLITGYRKHGEELFGINFFQHDPEFSGSIEIDESGYFISSTWWENTDTQAVMCMGPIVNEKPSTKKLIRQAIDVLEGRLEGDYSKGIAAYSAWKNALSNEKDFVADQNYSNLFEKMLCHLDAMSCLIDGRQCASSFFEKLSKEPSPYAEEYATLSAYFLQCAHAISKMADLYGNSLDMNEKLKKLIDSDIRKSSCHLIDDALHADSNALALMKRIVS